MVRNRPRIALIVGASTQLVVSFIFTGTNVVFPRIDESFDTSRTTLAWAVTGFAIVQASLLLVCGRLADRIGRKVMFERGLLLFMVASIAAAFAPTGSIFIAARLVQAVGAASVVPTALALVLHEYPQSRRVWVSTITVAVISVGLSATPPIAALLTELVSWRLLYLWAAALSLTIAVVGRSVFRESGRAEQAGRIDVLGVLLGFTAVAALTYAISEGPHEGWGSGTVVGGLAVAAVLGPLLVVRSTRHPEPLFDPGLFRIRSVRVATLVSVLTGAVSLGIGFAWPLMLTQTLGYSTLETGLVLTPMVIVMGAGAFIAGRLVDRAGPLVVVMSGNLTWIASFTMLLLMTGDAPSLVPDLLPGFLLAAAGTGLSQGPLQGMALRDVAAEVFGQVNALVLTVRTIGGALGVALATGLIGDVSRPPMRGFDNTHFVYLGIAVVASLATLFFPRHVQHPAPVDVPDDGGVARVEPRTA